MDPYEFLLNLLQMLSIVPTKKAEDARIKNLRMSHIIAMRNFKKHSAHLKLESKSQDESSDKNK